MFINSSKRRGHAPCRRCIGPPPTSSNAQSEQIHQPPATQAKGRKASTASLKVTPQPASSSPATSTSKSKPPPTDTTTSPSYPLPYPYSYHLSPSYSMTSYAINGAPPSASSMAPYPAPPGGGYPPPPSTAYPLAPSSIYPAPSSPSSPYYPSPYSPYPYPPYHAYGYPPPPHHPYSMTSPYGYPPNRYLPTPYQHPTPLPLHSPYHPHPHPSYPPVYGCPRGSTPPPYRSPPSNPTSGPNANASSSSSSSSSARQGVSAQTAVSAPNVASPKGKRKESDQDTTTAAAKGINTTAPAAETASSAIVAGVDPALTTMEVDATSAAGNGANSAGTTENDNEDAEEPTAIIPNARQCGNKTCRRTIPANVTGAFCEKCRLRMILGLFYLRHCDFS